MVAEELSVFPGLVGDAPPKGEGAGGPMPDVPELPVIYSSIVAESRAAFDYSPPLWYDLVPLRDAWKSLCKKYLPKSRVPCNYRLLPSRLGGVELRVYRNADLG